MNLLLVSGDVSLASAIAKSYGDALVVSPDAEDARRKWMERTFDVIILSDRVLDAQSLLIGWPEADKGRRQAQKIYLLSNRHHAGHNAAALKEAVLEDWEVIPPGLTVSQISDRVGRFIFGEAETGERSRRNGIIQFIGTTPNIGVTVASFGTALFLSSISSKKVAYLCLNLKSSKIHAYLGDREPNVSLDSLRAELRSGSLTGERLLQLGKPQKSAPDLTVFYGNMQREQADYYTMEEIESLLQKANEAFDYCVVETSAYWDNAGTIGAMRHADQRLLVTTQQLSNFQEDWRRWFGTLSTALGLSADDFDLIVTQTDPEALYRMKDVAQETGLTRIGELRKDRDLDRLLAEGRLIEAFHDSSPLGTDCRKLACTLLAVRGEPYTANRRLSRYADGLSEWNPFRWFGRRVQLVRK